MKKRLNLPTLLFEQRLLTILLTTLIAIFVWVGFSIYFSYRKTTLTPIDSSRIEPLNPKLDSTLFETLKSRISWTDEELNQFGILSFDTIATPEITPPSVSTPQTASNTAQIEPGALVP